MLESHFFIENNARVAFYRREKCESRIFRARVAFFVRESHFSCDSRIFRATVAFFRREKCESLIFHRQQCDKSHFSLRTMRQVAFFRWLAFSAKTRNMRLSHFSDLAICNICNMSNVYSILFLYRGHARNRDFKRFLDEIFHIFVWKFNFLSICNS